jgi:hypothetical protein
MYNMLILFDEFYADGGIRTRTPHGGSRFSYHFGFRRRRREPGGVRGLDYPFAPARMGRAGAARLVSTPSPDERARGLARDRPGPKEP